METILVPGPPKSAFNKNRPVSDLIRKQVEHFKHLEEKLPPETRSTLPQHAIVTEDDAARYIAAYTRLLRGTQTTARQPIAAPVAKSPIAMPKRAPKQKTIVVDLAAAAAPVGKKPAMKKASSAGAGKPSASGKSRSPRKRTK